MEDENSRQTGRREVVASCSDLGRSGVALA
jgi:hypothetical protein